MFEQTFVIGTDTAKKPAAFALSMMIEAAAVSLMILIPLIYTQTLPNAQWRSLLMAPLPPAAAPPTPPAQRAQTRNLSQALSLKQLVAPVAIPKRVNPISDVAPAPDLGVFGSTGGGGTSANDLISSIGVPTPGPPPPAAPEIKKHSAPIRVGHISEADLIRKVQPVYPPLAVATRVQGVVEFTAVIGKQGTIEHLQLVRGHPLLVKAARDAVLQWRYRPTLLNGQPVEVLTDIVVNFTLSQ